MANLPDKFFETLDLITKKLEGTNYCFRGTAGLILQGLDMNVDDIDVLCDKNTAQKANQLLKEYIIEPVDYKESPKFKSHFGVFEINNIKVEVYGDWQIKDTKGIWSTKYDSSDRIEVEYSGKKYFVAPVEKELTVFAQLGRWNAYHKIRRQYKEMTEKGLQPALF